MAKKLFIGGLPFNVTDDQLQEIFSKFGNVLSANVITDRYTGQSKGFGFVEMQNDNEAKDAIDKLDGTEMDGRKINVSIARPKEERPRFENNGNYRGNNHRQNNRNRY